MSDFRRPQTGMRSGLDRPSLETLADCTLLLQEHLVRSKGYPFERHHVTTADGYILEMHRIPGGKRSCPEPCHREPVLLMTGLATDSSAFVMDFPGQSLGFLLADNGYDVWLANTRGNTYGKQHANLSVKSKRFWDFSFHEHGTYDVPAQIDYVLKERQLSCLLYVGISQGTLMFFVMMSERPEYNAKVRARPRARSEFVSSGTPRVVAPSEFISPPTPTRARTFCTVKIERAPTCNPVMPRSGEEWEQMTRHVARMLVRLGYCATEAHGWARGGASASAAAMTSLLWNAQTGEAGEAGAAAAPARQLCAV
ncbi:hypothetical protein HPB47_011633 [Ixodes persulcatus]|uniref:Uncharacterized protein n=1 Tax=Ixodes persulcatus TaxID=34615 RepID=A0AC60NVQ9_IXOPE|nr:hypothetical protein HPB47_011633 [Ixodes persulcatus]